MESAKELEEAVASEFSLDVVRRNFGDEGRNKCVTSPPYDRARILVSRIDEDIIRLGRRLRERVGALEEVTPDIIKELYPNADAAVIETILGRLPRQ